MTIEPAGGLRDEALPHAVEAVRLWAKDAVTDGEELLPPRSAEALRADPDVAQAIADGAALAIVPLLLDAGRPAKANLSLDAGLLAAIDGPRQRVASPGRPSWQAPRGRRSRAGAERRKDPRDDTGSR